MYADQRELLFGKPPPGAGQKENFVTQRSVSLVCKLEALLGDILALDRMNYQELSNLFDEVILDDSSIKENSLVNGAKVIMATMIKEKILSKDQMQVIVDKVMNISQVKEQAFLINSSALVIN